MFFHAKLCHIFSSNRNVSLQAHLKSRFIMNGVCVMFKGYIDVQRLDGAGYLEYDDDNSKVEKLLKLCHRKHIGTLN